MSVSDFIIVPKVDFMHPHLNLNPSVLISLGFTSYNCGSDKGLGNAYLGGAN